MLLRLLYTGAGDHFYGIFCVDFIQIFIKKKRRRRKESLKNVFHVMALLQGCASASTGNTVKDKLRDLQCSFCMDEILASFVALETRLVLFRNLAGFPTPYCRASSLLFNQAPPQVKAKVYLLVLVP